MAVYNTTNIPDVKIARMSSGHGEIDWLLGSKGDGWGFVKKSLSLWGGEAGVGKTRFINGLCKIISKTERVLFCQLEMTVQSFRTKYLSNMSNKEYLISDSISILDQVAEIRKYKPTFVVIDSINKVKEFTGSDKTIKECESLYRKVASEVGCHIALITHLNAEGSIKGGTGLPHMVDTVISLGRTIGEPGSFYASIANKNRYGIPGKIIELKHQDRGVQVISDNRFDDKSWVEPGAKQGINLETTIEILEKESESGVDKEITFFRTERCETCLGSNDKCYDCSGMGTKYLNRTLKIKIPAGIRNGQAVRLKGEGDLSDDMGGARGDLHVGVCIFKPISINIDKISGPPKMKSHASVSSIIRPIKRLWEWLKEHE